MNRYSLFQNAELNVERAELESSLEQLKIQLQVSMEQDRQMSEQFKLQLESVKEKLAHVNSKIDRLKVSTQAPGEFSDIHKNRRSENL